MQNKKNEAVSRNFRLLIYISLFLIILGLYWYGAVQQLDVVNTEMSRTDQSAYMNYARSLSESNYTFVGTRNRMPVYPFLQSFFYRPGMTDEAFFVQGKYINLILSIGLLSALAAILRHFFSGLYFFNLLLIITFTIFIFKAGYFQVELLFYFINFCLFLLMWRCLQQPSWWFAASIGIVSGIAWLTKASILPGLAIFLTMVGIKWLLTTYHGTSGDYTPGDQSQATPKRSLTYLPLMIILVIICFLTTISPYINTSKQIYGHYFYNVNSTFYIWYDSWEEAKQGTRAHGDREGWPDMPADEIPSLSKYLREHTPGQIIYRLVDGAFVVLTGIINSYGYFKYMVLYVGLLIFAIQKFRQQVKKEILSNAIPYLFAVTYLIVYFLLYAWYAPIVRGNRLVLAQFIPFMFVISHLIQKSLALSRFKVRGHSIPILGAFNSLILSILVIDIYFILSDRITTMYGGF